MASPVTSVDFSLQNFGGDVCERIRKLLEINDTLKTFFEWFLNSDGTVSSEFKLLIQDIATPVGALLWRPVSAAPEGYLIANGQAVSRTTYANLFAVYGTAHGAGDGSTTFNLPDMTGRVAMGTGPGGTHPVGETGGMEVHTLTLSELPSHQHDAWTGAVRWNFAGATGDAGSYADVQGTHVTDIKTVAAGGSQPHNNLQPYMAGRWLVKT